MNKRIVLGIVVVFIAWQVLDFVLHGLLLASTYRETAQLWRPMAEMKTGLMRVVGLVASACFVCLYAWLVRPKSWAAGLSYGLILGVGNGFSMGFGTYSVMPMPQSLAVAWCIGSIVETSVAGLLVGWIVKDPVAGSSPLEAVRA
jgi:hypothetical protein